jgi:hypothetical protein
VPAWLVTVSGRLTDRAGGALSGAGMAVTGHHYGGSGPSEVNRSFTVELDADDAEQAKAKVADAIGIEVGFDVLDATQSGE